MCLGEIPISNYNWVNTPSSRATNTKQLSTYDPELSLTSKHIPGEYNTTSHKYQLSTMYPTDHQRHVIYLKKNKLIQANGNPWDPTPEPLPQKNLPRRHNYRHNNVLYLVHQMTSVPRPTRKNNKAMLLIQINWLARGSLLEPLGKTNLSKEEPTLINTMDNVSPTGQNNSRAGITLQISHSRISINTEFRTRRRYHSGRYITAKRMNTVFPNKASTHQPKNAARRRPKMAPIHRLPTRATSPCAWFCKTAFQVRRICCITM